MTRKASRSLRAFAVAACCAGLSLPLAAQTNRQAEFPFAVGAGGFAVTDTGRPADVKAFSTGGFRIFADAELEAGVILEASYVNFRLPGSALPTDPFQPPPGESPRVKVNGGIMSVGYLFRETWWQAGFIAGFGIFGLKPDASPPGQAPADVSETVTGWSGGLLTIFRISKRWEVRVEADGYLLRTDSAHKPILIGASAAYRF